MTSRRAFLKTLGGAAALCALPFKPWAAPADKRPNIVLILADDMGWSDLGSYGGEVDTPNLDGLAENGLRFTQFHNTAKCFPSRACLLTGVYAQQCGMDQRHSHIRNAITLGEGLRAAGYRTLAAGKHHGLENLVDRGFDRYFGLRDGACNYFNPGFQRPGEGKPAQKQYGKRTWCIDDETLVPYTPEDPDFYTTDAFTDYALQYLDDYADEDKPFFLYLAYTAPHDPLMAWPRDIEKYENAYVEGYEAIRQKRIENQKRLRLFDDRYPVSDPQHTAWDDLSEERRAEEARKMAVYAAMIDSMDQNIGRVLDKLRRQGRLDNTLVLFASDNGCSAEVVRLPDQTGPIGSMTRWTSLGGDWANVSNTPYRYFKNYSHQGGICTPFIAFWPAGLQGAKGRIDHSVAHFIDIMPTLLELAGGEYPATYNDQPITPVEGESLAPILRDEPFRRRRPLFWQWSRGKAVRDGKWKLVQWGQEWELYDMDADRTETNNVAAEHPDVVERLAGLHDGWVERCKQSPA